MVNTEKLLELIKQYPILYDPSHGEYRNLRKKDKIWKEIGEQLNETGDTLKKRWKNLKDTYAKYIQKARSCNTDDQEKKVKKWQWAEDMEVFSPYLNFAKTSYDFSDMFLEEDSDNDTSELSTCAETERDISTTNRSQHLELESTNASKRRCSSSDKLETKKRKWKVEAKPSSSVRSISSYLEDKQSNMLDSTDLLFLAHASTIKTFSKKRQAITKMKIAQVIMDQEILNSEE